MNENEHSIDKITALFHSTLSKFITPDTDTELASKIGAKEGNINPKNSYVAWFSPGIPYNKENFAFAKTLFGSGDVSGEEYRSAITTMAEMTRFLNTIPNIDESIDLQTQNKLAQNTGKLLNEQYSRVLQFSLVADSDPDGNNDEKFAGLRDKLVKTISKKNIVSDEIEEVTVPSDLVTLYEKYQQEYNTAWLIYTNKRRAAQIGTDKEAVIDWANNEPIYFNEVKRAYSRWISEGYKEDYELLTSTIEQIGARSMVNLKRDLQEKITKSTQVDPISNLPFIFTIPSPSNFYESDQGWTDFSYSQSKQKGSHTERTSFGGGGLSLNLGIFGAPPGSAVDLSSTGGSSSIKDSLDVSGFEIGFKICQVVISRPWFSPEFLTYNNWQFDPQSGLGMVSDGGDIPSNDGMIPNYPVAAYFVSDVVVKMNEFKKESSKFQRYVKAGGGVSIGPIRIGGHGGHKSVDQKVSIDSREGSLAVSGMQLIALRCQAVAKSPNPKPDITKWV